MTKEYIEREVALSAIKQAFEKGEGPSLYIKRIPAADVVEIDRLGKVGQLMLPYDGCPRGRVGRLGCSGGEEEKTALIVRELCYMDTFEDADGNVWRPVQEEVLRDVIEMLRNMKHVIQCKDCKHFTEGMAIGMCKRIPDKPVIPMPYNNYCGFSKRREE